MPKRMWSWAAGKRATFRAKRVGLWRRHGEVSRTLLVMGLVLVTSAATGMLLRAPRPAIVSWSDVSWPAVALWAATVAVVMIPTAIALVTVHVRRREANERGTPSADAGRADAGSPAAGSPAADQPKPWWARHLPPLLLRLCFYGGLAVGIVLTVRAGSWQTKVALWLTAFLAGACSCAALWWLGAVAIVLGGVVAAVVTVLVVDWPWLYEPLHLRSAILLLIVLSAVTLLAIAREFSRAVLRVATALTIGAVLVLTMKLGRVEARTDLTRDARRAATALDVQLADLLAEERDLPTPQTGQVDRAGRALLAAALALDASSPVRAEVVAAFSTDGTPQLDPSALREVASESGDVEVLGLAEVYDALRRSPRPTLLFSGLEAQRRIATYCQAADGRATRVEQPPHASRPGLVEPTARVSFVAGTYERCIAGDGSDDGDIRHVGLPERFADLEAQATWAVALIRAEVRETPQEEVAAAAQKAVVTAGGPDDAGAPVDLLATGGVALFSGVPGASDDSVPAAVTIIGWGVLLVLLILGYRWLEILNGRTQSGPVSVTPSGQAPDGHDQTETKRLAELRRHIVRNIDEPGAVPGAETLQPVTDLLEASGQPSGKIVGALLKLVGLVFPKTGYTVEAVFSEVPVGGRRSTDAVSVLGASNGSGSNGDTPPEPAGPPSELTVTVLVKDARTGRGRTTIVASGVEPIALREAGYRVAAFVLGGSSRSPSWAAWDESTASALCAYTEAMTDGSAGLDELEEAVRIAPSSGVLLGLLGHAYDLDKRHAYGLSAYLRAIALHPRYPVARYRAAISCSLLAAGNAGQWSSASDALRCELMDGLTAAADVLGLTWSKESRIGDDGLRHLSGPAAVSPLAHAGHDLLTINGAALTKASLVHHAFRRSERRYWLTLLLRFRSRAMQTGIRRDALYAVNESARPAVLWRAAAGKTGDELASLERQVRVATRRVKNARDLTWQVDYNLACAEAIGKSHDGWRDVALSYLQGLVRRPHLEQLTRSWVETDPDLEPLRSDGGIERLELVLRNLRSEPVSEWMTLILRHAADKRRGLGLDELVDVDHERTGAEAVFIGDPPHALELHDQRRAGEIRLRAWQSIPPGRRRQLPQELGEPVDELVQAEWRLAVEALSSGHVIPIDSSDPQEALARARLVLGPARDPVAIMPAGFTAPAAFREVRVLRGRSSLSAPMLVAVDERPLREILGQPLRFHHVVGKDNVGFVLQQRVGFVRRPGSKVIVLRGLAHLPPPDSPPVGVRASIT